VQCLGVVLAVTALAAPLETIAATPDAEMPVRIETSKAFGLVAGTFSASGAFVDAGTMQVVSRTVSAFGAPAFAMSHVTILLTGARGTITIKAQIVESITSNPLILSNEGSWAVVDGTVAYAALRGQGTVTGTADETIDLISRTFEGDVRLH
jgi:hypothetical protein